MYGLVVETVFHDGDLSNAREGYGNAWGKRTYAPPFSS